MTQSQFNKLTVGQKTWITFAFGPGGGQQYRGLNSNVNGVDWSDVSDTAADITTSLEINYQPTLHGLITFRNQDWNEGIISLISSVATPDSVLDSQSLSGTETALEYGWIDRGTISGNTTGYWSASTGFSYFEGDTTSWQSVNSSGQVIDSGGSKSRDAVGIPFELQAFIYPWQSHFGIGLIGTALVTQYSTFESIMLGFQGRF